MAGTRRKIEFSSPDDAITRRLESHQAKAARERRIEHARRLTNSEARDLIISRYHRRGLAINDAAISYWLVELESNPAFFASSILRG